MDQDTASRFVSALVQSIQALCHGYVEFSSSIEIVGHIYLNVDKGSKFDYIVNEEVNKDPGSLTTVFHTNSYHSVPPCKQLSTTTRLVDTNEASAVNRTLLQQSVLRDLISRPPPVIDTNLTSASSEFVLKDDLHSPRTMDSELNSSDESLNKRTQQTSSSSRRKRKKSPQRGRQGTQLSSALDPVVIKQEYGTSSQNSFIVENMINGEEHSVEEESLLDDEPCENETDSQFKDHEPYPVLMHAKLESGDLEQFASSVADAGDASPFATGPFAVSRHGGKRKRCHCCPQKLDNKYKDTCSNCGKNVCKAHSKIFCFQVGSDLGSADSLQTHSSTIFEQNHHTPKWTVQNLRLAIEAVNKGMTKRQAAVRYGIPWSTFYDKLTGRRGIVRKPMGVLTPEEERELLEWLKLMSDHGFSQTKQDFIMTVKNYLDAKNRRTVWKDNTPGRTWFHLFQKRHKELTLQFAQKLGRARPCITKTMILEWLQEFHSAVKKLDPTILSEPERIFSADESGFHLDDVSGKILSYMGGKYQFGNEAKTLITVLVCCNAAGNFVHPMLIYPGTQFRGFRPQVAFEAAFVTKTQKGWINTDTFSDWLQYVFIPQTAHLKKPLVLLVDEHKSHQSIRASSLCKDNGIVLYCLLPHASHILQPLNMGVFSHMKMAWGDAVRKLKPTEIVTKKNFAMVFKRAYEQATKKDLTCQAFRETGIFPLDPSNIDWSKVMTSSTLTPTDPPSMSSLARIPPDQRSPEMKERKKIRLMAQEEKEKKRLQRKQQKEEKKNHKKAMKQRKQTGKLRKREETARSTRLKRKKQPRWPTSEDDTSVDEEEMVLADDDECMMDAAAVADDDLFEQGGNHSFDSMLRETNSDTLAPASVPVSELQTANDFDVR